MTVVIYVLYFFIAETSLYKGGFIFQNLPRKEGGSDFSHKKRRDGRLGGYFKKVDHLFLY